MLTGKRETSATFGGAVKDCIHFFFHSILGVSPDCSQEQIRKHYKKIAVLVHPDKNKQPGAEEAFKVLQRSFELIGEPVS
jgi:curved DNA-binding protein CbpA